MSKGNEKKMKYVPPAFGSMPMATICSKTGCGALNEQKMEAGFWMRSKDELKNIVPKLPDDFSARADQNRYFIFEPSVQRVFELNETGGRILSLVDGKRTVAEIAGLLAAEMDANLSDILQDVSAFLNGLKNAGMNIAQE